MSSKAKIDVGPVALTELKAEISRRKIDADSQSFKLESGSSAISKSKLKLKRKGNSLDKEPSKIKKLVQPKSDDHTLELEKSRRTLEAKAKLYDALKQASSAGKLKYKENEAEYGESLVDFERKADEDTSCSQFKYSSVPPAYDKQYHSDSSDDESKVAYENLKRDYQESLDHVTYSHLRKGEIRTHGVGFYAFSKDLEEREREQARLEELHRQTEIERDKNLKAKGQRDAELGRRLAKLRARKGLPDLSETASDFLHEETESKELDLDVASMLRKMRDESDARAKAKLVEDEIAIEASNPKDVFRKTLLPPSVPTREWDKGK
ncbi:hypothetical protein Ciccas_008171 [Cichlidogyrus casuarinus]|uniref:Coiled-coil domain-containing protein 174 n=1 Tax=Cichlidogyrus casuarinus TaxID=1844966 RepID=A0ABD2Q1I2_9PLAT